MVRSLVNVLARSSLRRVAPSKSIRRSSKSTCSPQCSHSNTGSPRALTRSHSSCLCRNGTIRRTTNCCRARPTHNTPPTTPKAHTRTCAAFNTSTRRPRQASATHTRACFICKTTRPHSAHRSVMLTSLLSTLPCALALGNQYIHIEFIILCLFNFEISLIYLFIYIYLKRLSNNNSTSQSISSRSIGFIKLTNFSCTVYLKKKKPSVNNK